MTRAVLLRNDYILKQKPYNFNNTDGGLYAITPYSVDSKGYGLFKCGYANSFIRRIESYHTSLAPSGLWLVCFMRVKYPRNENIDIYLRRLERILFSMLSLDKDCIIHKPLTRVSVSEWVYTSVNTLHRIFDKLAEQYVDKNIKSNKLILNRLTLRDCNKWNNEQKNKKGKHLNTHIVVHIEPFTEQSTALQNEIKLVKETENRYNLRSTGLFNKKSPKIGGSGGVPQKKVSKKEETIKKIVKAVKRTKTKYGLRGKDRVDYKRLNREGK